MRHITPKMSTAIREILLFQRFIDPLETLVAKRQAINARVLDKLQQARISNAVTGQEVYPRLLLLKSRLIPHTK